MQWSQIKTIFILCFLVLNIYLALQFFDKREQTDVSILERHESTLEDQLEAENITYGDLPEEDLEESFISVGQKTFSDEEISMLNKLKNQKSTTVINKNLIISQYDKPIGFSSNQSNKEIEEYVKGTFIYPEEYEFWNWNKELNVLIFFQKKMDRPVYFNQNGLVLVFLDKNDELKFYVQTMLGDASTRRDRQSLIQPIKAIETLYDNNELYSGDDIGPVDIGFHTRVPLANGVQVFVPTWKVTVNKEKSYFVNAMEGFIFSSDEVGFLKEAIENIVDKVQSLEDEDMLRENILSFLETKLEE